MEELINALQESIKQRNWHAALFMALSLPDICGKIEYPDLKYSSTRYKKWCVTYLMPKYAAKYDSEKIYYPTGSDFYALRCALLHEGFDEINGQNAQENLEIFRFTKPSNGNTGMKHSNIYVTDKVMLQLQVDIFCQDIVEAIRQWLDDISVDAEKQQALYNIIRIYSINDSLFGNNIFPNNYKFARRNILTAEEKDINKNKIDKISKIIDKNLDSEMHYYARGILYIELGNIKEAIADFTKVIELNPNCEYIYLNRGKAYAEVYNINYARKDYDQALKHNSGDINTYINRGLAYIKSGNLDSAILDFDQAIKINPENKNALYYRGLTT